MKFWDVMGERKKPPLPKIIKCPSCEGVPTPKTVEYIDTGDVDHLFYCAACEFIFTPLGKPYLFSKPRKRPNPFRTENSI